MPENHIELDEGVGEYPRVLKDAVRKIKTNLAVLQSSFNEMDRMKTGDGSTSDQFQEVVDLFGVQADVGVTALARAKLLFDELNSALNNSAALKQFLAIVG